MNKSTLLIMLSSILIASCAIDKTTQRWPIKGAEPKILYSGFEPQESEKCTELAKVKCPYFDFSMKLPYESCADYALEKAKSVKANYMYIDEPFANIFGFNTGSYVAVIYSCKSLGKK